MVNEEFDSHSQIFEPLFSNHSITHISEPLFSNHSKTMMLKTKVDIHVFSDVGKIFFDMLSLVNIFSDIEPNVSKQAGKNWC